MFPYYWVLLVKSIFTDAEAFYISSRNISLVQIKNIQMLMDKNCFFIFFAFA